MAIALAAGAALLAATAVVLQRLALERAPAEDTLHPRLMAHALRSRIWLLGFVILLAQFGLQATALRFGQLSVVQPVLILELVFLIAILALVFHRRLGGREILGVAGVVLGLGAFFVVARPALGKGTASGTGWLVMTVACVTAAVVLAALGRTGPRWWRATAFGTAAALLFAFNAAVTKALTTKISEGWGHVFTSWTPYVLALTGLAGFFLLQNALHAGPLTASRMANVIVNPLVSIVIGVTAFQEHLRTGGGLVVAEVACLAVLCLGAVVLVRSPLVAGTGGGPEEELLAATPLPPPVL